MNKGTTRLLTGAIVLLAVAGIGFRVMKAFEKEESYETRPTVSAQAPQLGGAIILYTDLTATVEPVSRAAVQPKIGGEILEVNFQAGDYVEEGQVLCTIDSDALTTLKLQMENAQVAAGMAAREYERIQPLYAGGFVSQQSYEQARDNAASSRLSYEAAKNQYELQVEYTTVMAPISGIIESRGIDPHDHVGTSTQLCVISGGNQLQVTFGITEKTMRNLKTGDPVEITKNGVDYSGRITELGSMVNAATGLYDAKAAVEDAGCLTNGMKVKLTVVMDKAVDVMTVPVDAVSYDAGRPFVYCYENGTAKKTMVESGIYDAENMEIKSGLSPESMVITSWSNELVDNAQVILEGGEDGTAVQTGLQGAEEATEAAAGAQ